MFLFDVFVWRGEAKKSVLRCIKPFCHKSVTKQIRKALILLGLRGIRCHACVTIGVDLGEFCHVLMHEMCISIQRGFDVCMAHDGLQSLDVGMRLNQRGECVTEDMRRSAVDIDLPFDSLPLPVHTAA